MKKLKRRQTKQIPKTYIEALDTIIEEAYQNGLVGFKWHKLAYLREISYNAQSTGAAGTLF